VSDAGRYAAMEAEIVAALTGLAGVATIGKTLSLEDLVQRDGIRKPAVGIIEGAAEATGEKIGIGSRRIPARVTWEIAVVVQNQRGAVQGRPTLRSILEEVRDRLHCLDSTGTRGSQYRWRSDAPTQVPADDLVAAIATFDVNVIFGS